MHSLPSVLRYFSETDQSLFLSTGDYPLVILFAVKPPQVVNQHWNPQIFQQILAAVVIFSVHQELWTAN
jgi:hypothetical protein